MSLDSSTATINSYLEALVNRGEFAKFLTPDAVWTSMDTGDVIIGREAVRDFIIVLHTKLFDARPEVRAVVIADGIAALEADFVGTHISEFAGIPPTGASVRVPYCVVYDITDDGISALRGYLPAAQIVAQLQAGATTPA
jgi:predicted ester cyclase